MIRTGTVKLHDSHVIKNKQLVMMCEGLGLLPATLCKTTKLCWESSYRWSSVDWKGQIVSKLHFCVL